MPSPGWWALAAPVIRHTATAQHVVLLAVTVRASRPALPCTSDQDVVPICFLFHETGSVSEHTTVRCREQAHLLVP